MYIYINICTYVRMHVCIYVYKYIYMLIYKYAGVVSHTSTSHLTWYRTFFDGYCSTVQGLLDWFEVDLGFHTWYRTHV